MTLGDLLVRIERADAQLEAWNASRRVAVATGAAQLAVVPEGHPGPSLPMLGRPLAYLGHQLQVWRETQHLDAEGRRQVAQMKQLIEERRRLQRQIQSLATARRLLAIWHTIHNPLGVALFLMAFIHIGAAIYLATLLK
jgi:hypothetical protein